MTKAPLFTLEQRALTATNGSFSLGNYHSTELGKPIQCFTRNGFWLGPMRYRENYRLNSYNSTFKELYKNTDNDILKNALKNTLLFWQVDAGYTSTVEIRKNGGTGNIFEGNFFSDERRNRGLNVKAEVGLKIPVTIIPDKLQKDQRVSDKKILSPILDKGSNVMIKEQIYYDCSEDNCNLNHKHIRNVEIPYSIYLNSRYGERQPIEYNSFANASYIDERAVVKQAYSLIELDQSSSNEYDENKGYVEGLTHLRHFEEVLYDRREEYNSLVEKLKASGVENPDEFIKEYSAINGSVNPKYENDVLNYIKSKAEMKDFNAELIASELADMQCEQKKSPVKNDVKNDEHFELDETEYYNKSMLCDNDENDENIPYKERYLEQRGEEEDKNITGRKTGPFTKEDVPALANSIIEQKNQEEIYDSYYKSYLDAAEKAIARRNEIREKYGIDICNFDLNDKEYYVMSNAQEIYECSDEELAEIQNDRKQMAGKIYRAYKENVNKEIDNKQLRAFISRENRQNFARSAKNNWADFYNNLKGTLYIDTRAGINTDFVFTSEDKKIGIYDKIGVQPMGYGYIQAGIGYVTNFLNVSTGVTAKAGKYLIGGDEIKKPALNPYVRVDFYPEGIWLGDENMDDFDRMNHYNGWELFTQYEPVTNTITFGVSVNATPKFMKKK